MSFDPQALETPLAALDQLPRGLWLPGIINGNGTLPRRLDGVAALRAALLDARLPDVWQWPQDPLLESFSGLLEELHLERFCARHEELADQVLRSLLWHIDRVPDYIDRDPAHDEAAAIARAADVFRADWGDRSGVMDALVEVFGALGDACTNDQWDALHGLLRSEDWQDVLRVRRALAELAELRAVIRRLGRAVQTEEPDPAQSAAAEVMERSLERQWQRREARLPELPGETRGVQRSGRIARMLAMEAAQLAHPRLRLVWFARHAERTLLTYEDDATQVEYVPVQVPAWRKVERPQPERRLERGPMVVCVDTSGSMQGGAELVAKAVVLEAMRTAHAQGRACYVYAFSGPDEIVELALALDAAGIAAAVQFLAQSFHGGTDITGPLARALERIEDDAWQLADLLIASDGEFGATPALATRLRAVKRTLGLRVQAVLIGDRETIGLLEIADDLYWVRDWRRFGAGGDCPVHDKSLTALYFPGALRK